MENKSSRDLNPAWEPAAKAVLSDRENAFALDATAATHPIVRHVETVDQIGEAFDAITYNKGQAVIAMMEATVGPDRFRDGIRRYMARHRYGNTVSDDLWAELAAVAPNVPVRAIARDFTTQPGVPLVTLTSARCIDGATIVTLAQSRFGLDAGSKVFSGWHVPITIGTQSDGGDGADLVLKGLPSATATLPGCGAPLVMNINKASYVRVRYDDATHAGIVRNYPELNVEDRIGTLADDFALARSGDQDLSRYLAVMARVGPDADPLEWTAVTSQLNALTGYYEGTPLESALRARQVAILSPVFARVGFDAKPGESPLVTNLREELMGALGADGDPVIAARARGYVARLRADPNAIPPAIRTPILDTYAANATPAEWDGLLSLTEAEKSPVSRNGFVSLLGAARDPALATRALALLETRRLTDPQKASLLKSVAGAHPDAAFDWAVSHTAVVDGFLEASSRASYVPLLGAGSNDAAMPGKIRTYATTARATGASDGVKRALAGIAIRRAVAERLRPALAAWLGGGAGVASSLGSR